jgi:hypothetical protein
MKLEEAMVEVWRPFEAPFGTQDKQGKPFEAQGKQALAEGGGEGSESRSLRYGRDDNGSEGPATIHGRPEGRRYVVQRISSFFSTLEKSLSLVAREALRWEARAAAKAST